MCLTLQDTGKVAFGTSEYSWPCLNPIGQLTLVDVGVWTVVSFVNSKHT